MKILLNSNFAKKEVVKASATLKETTNNQCNVSICETLTLLEKLMNGFNNKDYSALTKEDLVLLRKLRFIHPLTESRISKEADHVS